MNRIKLTLRALSLYNSALFDPIRGGSLTGPGLISPSMDKTESRNDLIASQPGGDFSTALLQHLDSLYRYALSLTHNSTESEDLVQETCLKAIRSNDQFKEGTNLGAWLFTILRNNAYSRWRQIQKRQEEPLPEENDDFMFYGALYEEIHQNPAQYQSLEELSQSKIMDMLGDEFKKALDQLPLAYREPLFLAEVQELSYQEISGILQIPVGTVRSRLARARSALQKLLWNYAAEIGFWRRRKA